MDDIDIGLGIRGLQAIPQTLTQILSSLKQMETAVNGITNAFDNANKAAGKSGTKKSVDSTAYSTDNLTKKLNQYNNALEEATVNHQKIFEIEQKRAAIKNVTNRFADEQRELKKLAQEKEKVAKKEAVGLANVRENQQKVRLEYSHQIGVIKQLENRMSLLKQKMNAATDPKEVQRLSAEIRKLAAEKGKLTGGVEKLGKQTQLTSSIMGQFRGVLVNTFGAYAVIAGIRSTFNTIKEFEKSMTMVKAVTGATSDEMKTLFDITKNIIRRGSIFDPKTLAETQLELSKLGFTASEIAMMIEPINDLAIATGEDLTKASEIATSAMRSFGLSASDLSMVIDVMGTALNISALDLSSWNEAMKYAAPVANQLGWNIKDVASMTSLLANQQIKGSMAGTAMRQIFLKLADSNSNLQKAMGGNVRTFTDFTDGLQRMKDAGISLNEILEATDVRTTTAFSIMTDGSTVLKQIRDDFDNVNGAIKQMAEVNMQTLSAKLDQLSSSWANFVTAVDSGNSVVSRAFKATIDNVTEVLDVASLRSQYPFLYEIGNTRKILQQIDYESGKIEKESRERIERTKNETTKDYRESLNELRNDLNNKKISLEEFDKERLRLTRESNQQISKENSAYARDVLGQIVSKENIIGTGLKSEQFVISKETLGASKRALLEFKGQIASAYDDKPIAELNSEFTKTFNLLQELNKGDVISEAAVVEIEYQKMILDILSSELDSRKQVSDKKNKLTDEEIAALEKAERKRIARLKESAKVEYEIRKASIESNLEYTDSRRKAELMMAKKDYDITLNNIEVQEKDKLHLKEKYNQLNLLIEQEYLTKIQELHQSDNDKNIKLLYDQSQKELAEIKRKNDLDIELEKINLQELKNKLSALPKDDTVNKRALTDQILGKEFAIRMKEANYEIAEFQFQVDSINNIVGGAEGTEKSWLISVLGLTDNQIKLLEDKLKIAKEKIKIINPEMQTPEKRDIFSVLGFSFSDGEKDLVIRGMKEVEDAIVSMTNASVESAKAMAESAQTRVDELEQELQTEIQLAEQGFSSNVTLKRQQLEEEKKIRDAALEDQKRAQKQQLILQSVLDGANLISTVIKLASVEVATKGLAGIIAAGVGIAGLYALIEGVKSKSKQITSYEKGGYEYLKGRSHSQGGISLGEGREAQGGEMLAVFNRKATGKYGKQIEGFVNAINKDKLNINSNNVMSDSKRSIVVNVDNRKLNDIHGVLQDIRDSSVVYQGNYKIIRKGNAVRRIRMRE